MYEETRKQLDEQVQSFEEKLLQQQQQTNPNIPHNQWKNEHSLPSAIALPELAPVIRILHLEENPIRRHQERQNESFTAMSNEVITLRAQVSHLQNGDVAAAANVSITAAAELELVKSQLGSAQRRHDRMKEVFAKKVAEFREACYETTGFRIDAMRGDQVFFSCKLLIYCEFRIYYLLQELFELLRIYVYMYMNVFLFIYTYILCICII